MRVTNMVKTANNKTVDANEFLTRNYREGFKHDIARVRGGCGRTGACRPAASSPGHRPSFSIGLAFL